MTEFGQRHAALLPPLPRLRLAAAALILGAAFAGAAILHGLQVRFSYPCPPPGGCRPHLVRPEWVDPAALALCVLGFAVGAGLLFAPLLRRVSRVKLAVAVLILGAALASASILGVVGRGPLICNARVPASYTGPPCFRNPLPRWVDPAALALCVLGAAGAAAVLVTPRRRSTPE
jgi:hypothetical protein